MLFSVFSCGRNFLSMSTFVNRFLQRSVNRGALYRCTKISGEAGVSGDAADDGRPEPPGQPHGETLPDADELAVARVVAPSLVERPRAQVVLPLSGDGLGAPLLLEAESVAVDGRAA